MNELNGKISKRDKVQMTVRLKRDVYRRAKDVERRTGVPVSVIIADAAAETLLPPLEETAETKIENLSKRFLSRLEVLERAMGKELFVTKEILAQFARAYFNHTAAIPESERPSASMSGRLRFMRLVEQVKTNANHGLSILDDSETADGR